MRKIKPRNLPQQVHNTAKVNHFLEATDHPFKKEIQLLRKIILSSHADMGEDIKWNAPCFSYTGEMERFTPRDSKRDIVFINYQATEYILAVFPHGRSFQDKTGLLEGDFKDGRRIIKFTGLKDIKSREEVFKKLLSDCVEVVKKL
jgi:uncharacterized protein YdeI (YjbR/CyaY-like superfamily)